MKVNYSYGESFCFDFQNEEHILMMELIDDGFKSRGHRIILFNPDFKFFGCAIGTKECVMDFVGGIGLDVEAKMKEFGEEEFEMDYDPEAKGCR